MPMTGHVAIDKDAVGTIDLTKLRVSLPTAEGNGKPEAAPEAEAETEAEAEPASAKATAK